MAMRKSTRLELDKLRELHSETAVPALEHILSEFPSRHSAAIHALASSGGQSACDAIQHPAVERLVDPTGAWAARIVPQHTASSI